MNVNSMTPEELRALADKKEEEAKQIKKGTLKHDLYYYHGQGSDQLKMEVRLQDVLMTKQMVEDTRKAFEKVLEKHIDKLEKGTPFVCYKNDGEESWYDDVNFGIEDMSSEWAKENLEITL